MWWLLKVEWNLYIKMSLWQGKWPTMNTSGLPPMEGRAGTQPAHWHMSKGGMRRPTSSAAAYHPRSVVSHSK